jgi:hypothetical protein
VITRTSHATTRTALNLCIDSNVFRADRAAAPKRKQ